MYISLVQTDRTGSPGNVPYRLVPPEPGCLWSDGHRKIRQGSGQSGTGKRESTGHGIRGSVRRDVRFRRIAPCRSRRTRSWGTAVGVECRRRLLEQRSRGQVQRGSYPSGGEFNVHRQTHSAGNGSGGGSALRAMSAHAAAAGERPAAWKPPLLRSLQANARCGTIAGVANRATRPTIEPDGLPIPRHRRRKLWSGIACRR